MNKHFKKLKQIAEAARRQPHFWPLTVASICFVVLCAGGVFAYSHPLPSSKPTHHAALATTQSAHQKTTSQPSTSGTATAQNTGTKPGSTSGSKPAQTTSNGPSLAQTLASINQKLQPYGVVATFSPPNNAYTYSTWDTLSESDAQSLQAFATYLTSQFTKLPTSLVTNSGLKTIGLVKTLKVQGGSRASAPAPSISGMLYDVNYETSYGSAYGEEAVVHEYWHYLDYKLRGSYTYADADWSACNTAGFTYGSGGASAYGDENYHGTFHPQAGLVTQYAGYALEEDRAEMFAWLIYNPSSVKNLNDPGLNCKITRLTQIVQGLSPGMSF